MSSLMFPNLIRKIIFIMRMRKFYVNIWMKKYIDCGIPIIKPLQQDNRHTLFLYNPPPPNTKHFYLTQALSGDGCFGSYVYKFHRLGENYPNMFFSSLLLDSVFHARQLYIWVISKHWFSPKKLLVPSGILKEIGYHHSFTDKSSLYRQAPLPLHMPFLPPLFNLFKLIQFIFYVFLFTAFYSLCVIHPLLMPLHLFRVFHKKFEVTINLVLQFIFSS